MSDAPPQIPVPASGEFRVGRVLAWSAKIFREDFARFFVIGLLSLAPEEFQLIAGLFGLRPSVDLPIGNATAAGILADGLSYLASGLCYSLSEAASIYGVLQRMRGSPFRLSESVSRGLARFLPLVALSLLWDLGAWLGLALLVVPGLMFCARYLIVFPAFVMEGLGPVESMHRSAELTKGHRWKIFGIFVLIILASTLATEISTIAFTSSDALDARLAQVIFSTLVAAYGSIVDAVVFHDLRVLKDGIDIDRVAAVFD